MAASRGTTRMRALSGTLLRVDPLLPLVGVVATVTYWLHGFNGYLSRDLGLYAYAGQQVADGVPPYVGLLNRAGPLAHMLPAVGVQAARWAGKDELLGVRVAFLILSVACVCAVYLLGRQVLGSRVAGAVCAATFLSFEGFLQYASGGPREKTAMVLFLVLAFWSSARGRWFIAGVWLGLATLTLQIVLFVGLPVVIGYVLLRPRAEWLQALARVVGGGLSSLVVMVTYFAAEGAVGDFLDGFLVLNLRYTSASATSSIEQLWLETVRGYGLSSGFLLVGLVALLGCSVAALFPRCRARLPALKATGALGVGAIVGTVWTLRDFDGWPDLFPLLPLGALGVGTVVFLAEELASKRSAVAVGTAWCVLACGSAVWFSIDERDDTLVAQRRSVDAVLDALPDASMASVQAPQPLVLSGRTNPTRHQMFAQGLLRYLDDTWPGGVTGFVDGLVQQRPDLIAIGHQQRTSWAPRIKPAYVAVGCGPGWRWYARSSLGRSTVVELRQAARSARPSAKTKGCGAVVGTR